MSEDQGTSIMDVAEQVSGAVAKRLVEVFPGTRKYVPHKIDEDHELAVIGIHYARALSRVFGGTRLDIPMRMLSAHQRRRLILKLAADNMERGDIALRVGVCERRVYQVLQEAKDNGEIEIDLSDDRQASLF